LGMDALFARVTNSLSREHGRKLCQTRELLECDVNLLPALLLPKLPF
jgi:hypothetical protein